MNSASIHYYCMIKNERLNYRKTLTRIESDCTFRVGFSSLMNNISCTKQSNLFLHSLVHRSASVSMERRKRQSSSLNKKFYQDKHVKHGKFPEHLLRRIDVLK